MSRIVLDTSVISSLLNSSDANHAQAVEIFTHLTESHEIILPAVVVAELASVPAPRKYRESVIFNALEMATEVLSLDAENIADYVSFTRKIKSSCSAIDSIILFHAMVSNAELLTFDKKMQKIFASLGNI